MLREKDWQEGMSGLVLLAEFRTLPFCPAIVPKWQLPGESQRAWAELGAYWEKSTFDRNILALSLIENQLGGHILVPTPTFGFIYARSNFYRGNVAADAILTHTNSSRNVRSCLQGPFRAHLPFTGVNCVETWGSC